MKVTNQHHELIIRGDWEYLETCPYTASSVYTKDVKNEHGQVKYTLNYRPDEQDVTLLYGSDEYPMMLSKKVFNIFEVFQFEEFVSGCKL